MPNTYPSIRPQPTREPDGTARLLYIGTFGYFPNCDAVSYFCNDILPQIQDNCRQPVNVSIVGTGSDQLGGESCWPGVSFVGAVPDTAPWYANCDLAIVPLRAGAGTRIKILEAFSHRRAVVSTTIGAEGLKVTPGAHLGIADSAEAFAEQCLTLIDQPDKRNALAFNGHQFFVENHTQDSLESLMSQLFEQ